MGLSHWMSWEGGVDLCGMTAPGFTMPNVIVHVARMVHTPVGAAPAGMVLYQPDANAAPRLAGFISTDERVGRYFGPNIFAGTPFEGAPALVGSIEIVEGAAGSYGAIVKVAGMTFETVLADLQPAGLVQRGPSAMTPFHQQGIEAPSRKATLRINGEAVAITVPPVGISGGPAAVWSPTGLYAR